MLFHDTDWFRCRETKRAKVLPHLGAWAFHESTEWKLLSSLENASGTVVWQAERMAFLALGALVHRKQRSRYDIVLSKTSFSNSA